MSRGPRIRARQPAARYPAQYQQELVLHDGRTVLVRPILPSDAPELADAIKTADPDTLRAGSSAARPVLLLNFWRI